MTAAQKTAKLKFKQAIAYRQKTGVSLKEAFAHIYGKKVGKMDTELYKVVGKKNGQLVDITELPMTKNDATKFIKDQGIENFSFEVIKTVEYIDNEQLLITESCYMDKYDSITNGFNTKHSVDMFNLY